MDMKLSSLPLVVVGIWVLFCVVLCVIYRDSLNALVFVILGIAWLVCIIGYFWLKHEERTLSFEFHFEPKDAKSGPGRSNESDSK